MFKELFTESTHINETIPKEVQEIYNLLDVIFRNGYIKFGRKKFTNVGNDFYDNNDNIVGASLGGEAGKFPDDDINAKQFVFTGSNKDSFDLAVKQLISGIYSISTKRLNSWNVNRGKYQISIVNTGYKSKMNDKNPKVIWSNWYAKNYGGSNPTILYSTERETSVKWYGSTMGGYPRKLRQFYNDFGFIETGSTSGDGIGDSFAVVKGKNAKIFNDMLKELGVV